MKVLDIIKYFESDLPAPDIFYDRKYLEINNFAEEGDTYVAYFQRDNTLIIYPFVKREIPIKTQEQYFDIITPYEYGGPIIIGEKSIELLHAFVQDFENYCSKNNIVSEFIRFNPVLQNQEMLGKFYPIDFAKDNIVLNLSKSEEEIFGDFHKNNRRDIRLAIRKGVSVHLAENNEESIEVFKKIYFQTMDSKMAKDMYYFSPEYFNRIIEIGKEKLSVFIAYDDNQTPISAAMFLHGKVTTHYHLSGTLREYSKLCPNNLLLYTAVLHSKQLGKDTFHFGGAAGSQAGLYAFKSKFSPERMPYYIAKKIHMKDVYQGLVEQKSREDKSFDINSGFFPLYRL
jgi:serine/alanine adding enzyme